METHEFRNRDYGDQPAGPSGPPESFCLWCGEPHWDREQDDTWSRVEFTRMGVKTSGVVCRGDCLERFGSKPGMELA